MQRLIQTPTDPAFVQDPYPFYARARAAGDIVHWDGYGICATSHAAVAALAAHPAILRVKGSIAIAGRPAPLFVQAVGPRVETWFGRPGTAATGLVVIGLAPLDAAALDGLEAVQAA